jgi:hypothetical protein
VSGSNRFPSPPARINPQRWLCESLPLNSIEPNPSVCGHTFLVFAPGTGQNEADVPFRKYRHLRSRFRAFNLFRGILIARQRRKRHCRERCRHVWTLSQRMSKCRQKSGRTVYLSLESVF